MRGFFGPFVHLKSWLGNVVKIHESDVGKIAIYERAGWEHHRPTVYRLG